MAKKSSKRGDKYMTFGEHLEELRQRIIYALLGVAVTCVLTLYFGNEIIHWLFQPYIQVQVAAGRSPETQILSVAGGFTTYLKVSIIAGLIIAGPWVLYQMWRFVASGLFESEQKTIIIIIPFSAIMTALGVLFSYYLMVPICLQFLLGFTADLGKLPTTAGDLPQSPITQVVAPDNPKNGYAMVPVLPEDPKDPTEGAIWINAADGQFRVRWDGRTHTIARLGSNQIIKAQLRTEWYFSFIALITLGAVIAFQLPPVMMIVGLTGLVQPSSLARYRKHSILVFAIVAALLTPADPLSMIVLAVPLYALFEFGLLVMRLTGKKPADEAASEMDV